MKVCDLISKMVDSYVDIAINEYKGLDHTGRRYIIEKHSTDYTKIPKDVWNAEVNMIVPYYDRISIEIAAIGNMDKTDKLILRAVELEKTISSEEQIEIDDFEGDIWISRYSESRGSSEGIEKFCHIDEIDIGKLKHQCDINNWWYVL